MFLIRVIRFLLSIYALMQLVQFALPYIGGVQSPWMVTLGKFCEPGIRIGNQVISRLLPDRQFKIDMGPLAAAALCYLARLILGIFF
ncbi:MAG: YggT family protein [Clostridia bacterium]|nr:YggT family protein [Clostridia bacterium]